MISTTLLLLFAIDGGTAAPQPTPLPKEVAALLNEKDASGQPIIGDDLRTYLQGLPDHTVALIARSIDSEMLASADHLKILLSLKLSPQATELLFTDNCIVCHTDPENQRPHTLFSPDPPKERPHLNFKEFLSDVHFRRGLSCAGCHGGAPTDKRMVDEIYQKWPKRDVRQKDRSWIPEFCASCHSSAGRMRQFNPSMPTDQLAKYRESRHGIRLLQEKDSRAAQCVSCHGVHGIRSPKSRLSLVHPQRVPETCGSCHADKNLMAAYKLPDGSSFPTNQLEDYRRSVHGHALLEKGDLGAPACNSCHGNHAALPPAVASVAQICRTCHVANGTLFDGSKHKIAFEAHKWPECEKCHGKHAIEKPTVELLGSAPGTMCGDCHATFAKSNPECNATADHFHDVLTTLDAQAKIYSSQTEQLAARGLDVAPPQESLEEFNEAYVKARTSIHAFDRGTFDGAAEPGKQALSKSQSWLNKAKAEYHFRRNGLMASIALMVFLAAMLYLKIREVSSRS